MLRSFFHKENTLLFLVLLGLVFGNIFFYSVSIVKSLKETRSLNTYWWHFFLRTTVLGLIAFFFGFIFGSSWPKSKFLLSFGFLAILITLILILFLQSGSKRWLSVGSISLQPSELTKPLILLFAGSLVANIKNVFGFSFIRMFVFWLPVFLVVFLVFLQPALTNSLIIFISSFVVYLALKPSWQEILVITLLILLLLVSSFFWEYRIERLLAFLQPDTSEKSLQAKLAQDAVSAGGFFGKGLGGSVYKIIGLPEMFTDSIFAIIGEEIGFVGIVLLLFFYLSLWFYLLKLGRRIEILEGKAFVYGAVTWLALQTAIHIAGNLGLIPLTGVVLPFFSQGGSAQIAILFSFGIIKGFYERWA